MENLKERLFSITPFRFYSFSIEEYYGKETEIYEYFKRVGFNGGPFVETKLDLVTDSVALKDNGKFTGMSDASHKGYWVCFIHTLQGYTYWLVNSNEKPVMEDSFIEALDFISDYEHDDLADCLEHLRNEELVDFSTLNFSRTERLRVYAGELKYSILECFANAEWEYSARTNWEHKYTQDFSWDTFIRHINS